MTPSILGWMFTKQRSRWRFWRFYRRLFAYSFFWFDEKRASQELYFCLRGSSEANCTLKTDNGVGLLLSLGLRRVVIGLLEGRIDDCGKRKKVVLKCGNVGCKRHINAQDFSCITQ